MMATQFGKKMGAKVIAVFKDNWIKDFGVLTVIFLPKRSPNLNPVETRVNRNLKKDVCANHNYPTEENLTNAVRRYLRCIGG